LRPATMGRRLPLSVANPNATCFEIAAYTQKARELAPDLPVEEEPTSIAQTASQRDSLAKDVPRQRYKWTQEELDCLEQAMETYKTHWTLIVANYGEKGTSNQILRLRSQMDLKDKARNELKKRLKEGTHLGAFIYMDPKMNPGAYVKDS